MKIKTRSMAVRRSLGEVARRLPPELWQRLSEAVTCIRGVGSYEIQGFGRTQTSAALCPLWDGADFGKPGVRPEMQILVFLPVFRRFSHRARVGILAHELSHVYVAIRLPGDWHDTMQRRYTQGEKAADRLASSWGFAREIKSLRRERELSGTVWEQNLPKTVTNRNAWRS